MANNQPFVLKNAVEVGKNIDVTLGTISSSTVDLSTGNYFNDTLTANTTYTFSNPGDVQAFQMEITGNGSTITWPSSVDWSGGTEPADPASGQKDIYSFITPDSGTTYYGFKSATNVS